MFKRKKRRRLITILAEDGRTLFHGDPAALDIPDPVIVALSTEFFSDPEPCEIHRGAVRMRVIGEFEETIPLNETVSASSLPGHLNQCLPVGAYSVTLTEEG